MFFFCFLLPLLLLLLFYISFYFLLVFSSFSSSSPIYFLHTHLFLLHPQQFCPSHYWFLQYTTAMTTTIFVTAIFINDDNRHDNHDKLKGCPRGVMVKAMNCGIVVREFVLQSRYYVHFRANTLGKGMNPLILPPAMGK